ncbi:MAG: hypothetical protein MRK02_05050 [Candidatus Scalindua sp.]|nr:hypothetical protein [Candidatus Scalindua sp.]
MSQGTLICNVKYSHSNVSIKQYDNGTHEEIELFYFGKTEMNVNYSVPYSDVCIVIKAFDDEYDRDENGKYVLGAVEVVDECMHIKLLAKRYLTKLLTQLCDQKDSENIYNTTAIITLASRIDNWKG